MKVIVNRKKLVANEEVYNVMPDVLANGSVAFLADLPKGAIVTSVIVNGKSLEDYLFDDEYGYMMRVIYPKTMEFEGHRVIAMFMSPNAGELYHNAVAHMIEEFTVEYVETAISEV